MHPPILKLKKNEDRRIRAGHLWIFSNEIDNLQTPLKKFTPGETVLVHTNNDSFLGVAYVNPHSLIAARIVSTEKNDRLDLSFLKKRITAAHLLRKTLWDKPYYRLIFGESDYLPGLVVDQFDTHLIVQINTLGMDKLTPLILQALREVLPETKTIVLKNDSPMRELEGLEMWVRVEGDEKADLVIEENHTRFYAPLLAGQKTGWFYDHRFNRSRLKEYVNHKKVLDVFSYLGAWGIQAAIGGAKEVLCIDTSPLSQTYIPKNADLNHVMTKVTVKQQDAFLALKELHQHQETYDVIVLDPPAFIKKQKDKKEGLLAYQRMNELALKLLSSNGILFTCSCSQHMSEEEFVDVIRRAGQRLKLSLQLLERGHQAPDHPEHPAMPETHYLKMIVVRNANAET